MSQAVNCFSKITPCYGPSDSSRSLPCSGVSGRRAVTVSTHICSSLPRSLSQGKTVSLKHATMDASLTCRADSRRNSDFSKQNRHGFSRGRGRQKGERYVSETPDESELLSSRNGSVLSLSGNPKFQTAAAPGPREKEIVELFRKVQAQLRERGAMKEEKKMEGLKGQNEENEPVDSLLKLLRTHSVEHRKRNSKHEGSGGGNSGKDFSFDQCKQDGSFDEAKNSSSSRSNGVMQEESQEHNISSGRPASNFRRKSPIPRTTQTKMPSSEPEPEPELVPEPELELELEHEHEPELEPEHTFSDELEFDVSENSANDGSDNEDREIMSESRDLTALKVSELRSLAKSCGVKGFSKMKKSELVEVLSQSSL